MNIGKINKKKIEEVNNAIRKELDIQENIMKTKLYKIYIEYEDNEK